LRHGFVKRSCIAAIRNDAIGGEARLTREIANTVILPAMTSVRAAADELETLIADDLWPLPNYQEMLFIL
jgi:glutamine synthetase